MWWRTRGAEQWNHGRGDAEEAKDHETRKQFTCSFCCLISSSINYERMQRLNLEFLKKRKKKKKGVRCLLASPILFPANVISFHVPRVNMPLCRQPASSPDNSITLQCSVQLSKTSFVKAAATAALRPRATGTYTRGPAKQHSLYNLLYNAERKTEFSPLSPSCVLRDMFYSKPSPSWLLFDFARIHFPGLYGASLSMGGVPFDLWLFLT